MARLGSHLAWQVLLLASSGVLIRSEEAKMTMPGARPAYADSYLCSTFSTKSLLTTNQVGVSYITGFRPIADAGVAHHMLLHKCNEPTGTVGGVYDCLSAGVCQDHSSIMFGWAKNAQSMQMPQDVSMHVNTNEVKYFVLQVHYAKELDKPDNSTTLIVETTDKKTRYDANMLLLFRSWMQIPPNTPMYHGDMNCKITQPKFHPFAFRTHSHAFGTVTTGYKYSPRTGQMTEFARGNPQWPQAFYPVKTDITFEPGDYIIGRCSYNTTGVNREIHVGATHDQEMCNLYVMYYLEEGAAMNLNCPNEQDPSITRLLPADSDKPLPPNPDLELKAKPGHGGGSNRQSKKKILSSTGGDSLNVTLTMPGALPKKTDSYLCSAFDARTWSRGEEQSSHQGNSLPLFIQKFAVDSTAEKVHHLIVKACAQPGGKVGEIWNCMHHSECQGPSKIMYAWAKDAPPADIPNEVGFKIDDQMPFLTLQVHYKNPLSEKDYAGVNLRYTTEQPKYFGGIYLMLNPDAILPPHQPRIDVDVNCKVRDLESPLTVFAYRTHAHKHGTRISGYRVDAGDETREGKIVEIARGDPQKPQAFYPTTQPQVIHNGDWIAARCEFNTVDEDKTVRIGATAGDEMCNLYMMFYTKSQSQDQTFLVCAEVEDEMISKSLPKLADPNPSNIAKNVNKGELPVDYENGRANPKLMDPKRKKQFPGFSSDSNRQQASYHQVNNWPVPETMSRVGQPSGIAIDIYGNPTVFHRGDRIWDGNTFNCAGQVINSWGRDFFFLPHMITIDAQNNFWVTDVALHQVFKFEPYGGKSKQPLITLGQRFEPGTDDIHYCKPTSVAVAKDGKSFYVADGYCNSRIIKYSLTVNNVGYHNVTKLYSWGEANSHQLFVSQSPYALNIPHGLALAESLGLICVADRENGRVQCYRTSDAQFEKSVQLKEFSSTIYGIDFNEKDGMLFAISGPEDFAGISGKRAQGYQIDLDSVELVDVWNSGGSGLARPHDVAVSRNGTEIYVVDLQPFNVIKLTFGSTVITNSIPAQEARTTIDNPVIKNSSPTSLKDHLDDGIRKLQGVLPASNTGIIIAMISLSLTLVCSIVIACRKCKKRGKGKLIASSKKKDRNPLDLGDLLGRSKDGFQPLNTDDAEVLSSDSEDLDDFKVPTMQA